LLYQYFIVRLHHKTKIMVTKTEQLRQFWKQGESKKALKIFKTFKIGITKEQKRTIEIAYEVLTGKENFYISLGIDTAKECQKATEILNDYLIQN